MLDIQVTDVVQYILSDKMIWLNKQQLSDTEILCTRWTALALANDGESHVGN